MADSLASLLGLTAQERLASDPFYLSGVQLQRQQITPTNNLEAVLIPALQGFAAGGLQGYGQAGIANSMREAASPLVQALKISPSAMESNNPFEVESAIKGALLQNEIANKNKEIAISGLKEITSPRERADLIKALLGQPANKAPDQSSIATPEESPFAKPAAKTDPLISALSQGGETTLDKYNRIYDDLLNRGNPPAQAAVAAREQIQGENKANQSSFDAVKAAREKALAIQSLADTADAGIKLAGQTGFFPTVASGYEKLMSALGSSEAASQSQGDSLLNSIQPEIVKMSRTPGAVSDREMQSYIQSAPSTKNTPEQNIALSQRIRELGKLENEYADFLSAYRDANNGSTINADKLWNQYRAAVPLFDESGSVNSSRMPWQEFFKGGDSTSQGAGILAGDNSAPIEIKTLASGEQVKVRRLPNGGYEEVN